MFNDTEIKEFFLLAMSEIDIAIDDQLVDHLMRYFTLLLEKNQSLNLISSKQDLKTQIVVHLVDSLSILLSSHLPSAGTILDFGSGGGLPAIPLSIVLPNLQFTLIDSTRKKTDFLLSLRETLKLNNVSILNRYLEPNSNKEDCFYNFITARAVSKLNNLLAIAVPRLLPGGIFAAYKGPHIDVELSELSQSLKKMNVKLIDRIDFSLPFVQAQRSLVFFLKM